MIRINNYVTKVLSNDANNSFSILTYLDIEKELCPAFVLNYAKSIVGDNPILTHDIVKKGDHFYFKKNNNFNIDDHVVITHVETEPDAFASDDSIHRILNQALVPNTFLLVCCINKAKQASRIYFKINHAYTDGYGLINMLTKPILKRDNIPEFKRKTSVLKTMYHCIIGTLILFAMNVKIFLKIFVNNYGQHKHNQPSDATDFIVCKPFMLDKIKRMAVKNGITVNDFLYSLMIKTDRLYTKNSRTINTCSPINVSKLSSTNNMTPVLNCINNSLDNRDLVKRVNRTFNHFKYSLFIPLFSRMINTFVPWVNLDVVSVLYEEIIHNCDYVYSNVIGPPIKEVNESNVNVSDIHFLTKSKGNSVVFNIISCENKINIVCSFKTNKITNKKRFEKCIYRAYNELINLDLMN